MFYVLFMSCCRNVQMASNTRRSRNNDELSSWSWASININGVSWKDYTTRTLNLTLTITLTLTLSYYFLIYILLLAIFTMPAL